MVATIQQAIRDMQTEGGEINVHRPVLVWRSSNDFSRACGNYFIRNHFWTEEMMERRKHG